MTTVPAWNIGIDTGGTFTDCFAIDPGGSAHRIKVLSSSSLRGKIVRKIDPYVYSFEAPWNYDSTLLENYILSIPSRGIRSRLLSVDYKNRILTLEDNIPPVSHAEFDLTTGEEAPVLAIRLVTKTRLDGSFPPIRLRIGTTKGTNALLEKKGANTLLILTKGFGDLLRIGTQQRPHLFQLAIPDYDPLYMGIFELDERISSSGEILTALSNSEKKRLVEHLQSHAYESIGVSLLNAYHNPIHEQEVISWLKEITQVPVTSGIELFSQINYLRRSQTTVVDAYLAPIISTYLSNIRKSLGDVSMQVMTSAGGLVGYTHYRAKDSLLSGPAGGMMAAARLARRLGFKKVLTFDMGGTSTDTARIDERPVLKYITRIDQSELLNPCFAIETVAAGGGSVCWYDGFTLRVGPQSAGASPGPACYGAGGPLTITDVNLLLGKLETGQFEIPISLSHASRALHALLEDIEQNSGTKLDAREVLEGLEKIANEKMAEAIRKISVSEGADPSDYALLTFGGAGGLHGCQLADLLQIRQVIIPYEAGIFSAVGVSNAPISRLATRQILLPWETCPPQLGHWVAELTEQLQEEMKKEGISETEISFCTLFLRFSGQEKTLEVPLGVEDPLHSFQTAYQKLYGYLPENKPVELESIRMQLQEKISEMDEISVIPEKTPALPQRQVQGDYQKEPIPVYDWQLLQPGSFAQGPCIITATSSTTFVPAHWHFNVQSAGDLLLQKEETTSQKVASQPEAVELELFTNRFYAIAEEMGAQLQRTAFSVNVKERLDFSCALLDAQAYLLVNAPHIPVHLGSLGLCARLVREVIAIEPGDVIITNHPKYGGSHLPDVTLLAGVFTPDNVLVGYVINRAHHAEIGGTRTGSMPPDATTLAEEGVVIQPSYLVRKGIPQWESLYTLFNQGPYPTRMWAENEADIIAALSSLQKGQQDLLQLVDQFGLEKVTYFMQLLKDNAHQQLQSALQPYLGKRLSATEFLDDGHRISVHLEIHPNQLLFDFKNTSRVHPNNLNANLSILHSAILYVLRLLIDKDIPLNDGLMQSVEIVLPENSLLHPVFSDDPTQCPAVVGGNTEVSQRLVDTLLKAFELAACSQGTMNNFLFGNEHIGYYETIGGGVGASPGFHGRSGIHQHMTNTRITDAEEMERRYPVRIRHFGIRAHSGGKGRWNGGDGLVREIEFLENLEVTLLSQHRYFAPYGLAGGNNGQSSDQTFIRTDGKIIKCPGICSMSVRNGDRLIIETPGGGGYGTPTSSAS